MEKRDSFYTVGGNANWHSHYGEECGDSLKNWTELPYNPAIPLLGTYPMETRIERDTCTQMPIAALFIIVRTWKKPRCPLTDEWIRKLWYIHTVEYYSAIKRNAFESVLMRWMTLEPIIEWSKKEKDKYCILTPIYGIQKVLHAGQQRRHRHKGHFWTQWEKARVGWCERTA